MRGLKLGQCSVGQVWTCISGLCAALVVEVHYQLRITAKPFGCGDVFDAVVGPKTIFSAEGADAAFG